MLNVWGGFDVDKTRVDMWLRDATIAQRFSIIVSGSYYKLRALCSSTRVLDAYRNSDGSITSGCQADIWSNNDDAAQQLIIEGSSTSGYTICLASKPSLALTAVDLSNDGAVQFRTKTGAKNQRWCFEDAIPLMTRYPDYYCQNKDHWCWAAAAKMVGIHNGGGLKPEIDTNAKELENTGGLHDPYYGYNGSKRYVDGVQYAIVTRAKDGKDLDATGNTNEIADAIKYVAKKNLEVKYIRNYAEDGGTLVDLTQENINFINKELNEGRYVVGFVDGTEKGHFIVLQKYNADDTYTVFNPWDDKKDKFVSSYVLFKSNQYKYLTNATGKMYGFQYCY